MALRFPVPHVIRIPSAAPPRALAAGATAHRAALAALAARAWCRRRVKLVDPPIEEHGRAGFAWEHVPTHHCPLILKRGLFGLLVQSLSMPGLVVDRAGRWLATRATPGIRTFNLEAGRVELVWM